MSEMIRVYVNAKPVDMPTGSTILDAVRAWNPESGDAVAAGTRRVVDSRGLPVAADGPITLGAIFRLVSARAGDADA